MERGGAATVIRSGHSEVEAAEVTHHIDVVVIIAVLKLMFG